MGKSLNALLSYTDATNLVITPLTGKGIMQYLTNIREAQPHIDDPVQESVATGCS